MRLALIVRFGILFALATSLALAHIPSQTKTASQASAKKAPTKAPSEPVAAQIGSKESAKWTGTTTAAAGTPEQKAVLDSGKPLTVTGELVEVSCYLQLGKRGEKHIPCGTKCLQNGQPFGVVSDGGQLFVLMAEEHDPRRDGQADLRASLIPLLAKRVTVTGMHTTNKGYHAIFVSISALPPAQ